MARKLPTWMNELTPVEISNQGATPESINAAVAYDAQRTFHSFPRLPSELRSIIWRYSRPLPRILRATVVNGEWQQTFDYHPNFPAPDHCYEPPNLFGACTESERAIRRSGLYTQLNNPGNSIPFWVDLERDILSIGPNTWPYSENDVDKLLADLYTLPQNSLDLIKRIAIERMIWIRRPRVILRILQKFRMLKEIFFQLIEQPAANCGDGTAVSFYRTRDIVDYARVKKEAGMMVQNLEVIRHISADYQILDFLSP